MIETIVIVIFAFFKSLGIWGAFLSMVIENVGIPLPTEIGYLIGQDLIERGVYSYVFMVFFLTLGHVLGSLFSYSVGRWSDSFIVNKVRKSRKIVAVHDKIENWYKKYGDITVFLTRFVGYVRPWSSFVAGFAKVPFWPFLLWTTLGSLIFNIICLYFSSIFLLIWRNYAVYHFAIIVIFAVTFSALIIWGAIKYFVSLAKKSNK